MTLAISGYYIKISGVLFTPDYFTDLTYKIKLNQMWDCSAKFFGLSTTQETYMNENNTFWLYTETDKLILAGRVQKKTYDDEMDEYTLEVNDDSVLLYDTVYPTRQQFTNTNPSTIVNYLISGVMSAGTIDSNLNPVSFRIEHDSRLGAIASLGKICDVDWWVSHDVSMNPQLNFTTKGNNPADAVETFDLGVDVFKVDRLKKSYEVWNVIRTMGYGDGINQKTSEDYHATTTQRTNLVSNLVSGYTTLCAVQDVSNFNNSGVLRIGIEEINYTSRNTVNNEFAGLSRGTNNTTVYTHDIGIEVYDIAQYTKTSPETGSSIDTYGIKENVYTDRSIRDQNTLDLLAQRLLNKYYDTVERIKVSVDKEFLASADVGDYAILNPRV